MKKIVSMFLVCVLMAASFSVYANDNAAELKKYGIMKGEPDGNVRLADKLTRAEAVTLLVRMYGFIPETSVAVPANVFSDMETHWACNAAMIAKNLRITDVEDGAAFNPGKEILAEEFIKMIIELLGYGETAKNKGGGTTGYIMQASQLGITKEIPMIIDKPVTRGDAVGLLCNSLDVPIMVMTTFSFGGENEYAVLDGKNGAEYRTLRTMLESK